jgi:hypothetical protein
MNRPMKVTRAEDCERPELSRAVQMLTGNPNLEVTRFAAGVLFAFPVNGPIRLTMVPVDRRLHPQRTPTDDSVAGRTTVQWRILIDPLARPSLWHSDTMTMPGEQRERRCALDGARIPLVGAPAATIAPRTAAPAGWFDAGASGTTGIGVISSAALVPACATTRST